MPREPRKYYHCTTCHYNVRRTLDGVDHSWRCTPGTNTANNCDKCNKDKQRLQQAILSIRTKKFTSSSQKQFPYHFLVLTTSLITLFIATYLAYLAYLSTKQ